MHPNLQALVLQVDEQRSRVTLSTKKLEPTAGDMVRDKQLVYDCAEEMAERYLNQMKERQESLPKASKRKKQQAIDGLGEDEESPSTQSASAVEDLNRMRVDIKKMTIRVGQVISGVVQSILTDVGVNVTLENGSIGTLLTNQISNERDFNVDALFSVGDRIKVILP